MVHKMEKTPDGMSVMVPTEASATLKIERQVTKFHKTADGSITVEPTIEIEEVLLPVPGAAPVDAGLGKKAVVSALMPDPNTTIMDDASEVSWTDLRPTLSKIDDTLKHTIDGLVGQTRAVAEEILNGLVKTKNIIEFRVLKSGQSFTMDVVPGRVQLLVSKGGLVQSAQIG